MNETLLLTICAALIVVGVIAGRRIFNAQKMTPLTSRQESLARLALTVIAAFVAHWIYGPDGQMKNHMVTFWFTVVANAFLIYGATHFFDRLVDRVNRVAAR